MKITNVNVYGLDNAILTSRYPKVVNTEEWLENMTDEIKEDAVRVAKKLANTPGDSGHLQWLTGVTVTFDMNCSIQLWQEAERYRFLFFVSSTSKMHRLHKMKIRECCNEYTDERVIKVAEELQEIYLKTLVDENLNQKKKKTAFYNLIYSLPQGFEYTAGMITNYRELKQIYHQRKNHRLDEWHVFCEWVETLPMSELITGKKVDE